MLELLEPGTVFWINTGLMNTRGAANDKPEKYFAEVQGSPYRLKRPDQNRVVQFDTQVQTLGKGVWAVASASHGESKDPKKNFRWLPYWAGYITYAPIIPGIPVITGRMNGCLIVIFRMNGQRYLGHIGTSENALTKETIDVKNAWKLAFGRGLLTLESQFNPTENAKTMITFAALSGAGNFYSIDLKAAGPTAHYEVVDKNLMIGSPTIPVGW